MLGGLVKSSWVNSVAGSAKNVKLPEKDIASYVVKHLDVTTFRSSIGPRRETGKTAFSDYGFKIISITPLTAELKSEELNWAMQIRVLRHTASSITICFHDVAENGGSYNAQSCLRLREAPNSDKLIAVESDVKDERCPHFAK